MRQAWCFWSWFFLLGYGVAVAAATGVQTGLATHRTAISSTSVRTPTGRRARRLGGDAAAAVTSGIVVGRYADRLSAQGSQVPIQDSFRGGSTTSPRS